MTVTTRSTSSSGNERMMDEMMGAEGDVHIDRDTGGGGADLHVDVHETDEEIRVDAEFRCRQGRDRPQVRRHCPHDQRRKSGARVP